MVFLSVSVLTGAFLRALRRKRQIHPIITCRPADDDVDTTESGLDSLGRSERAATSHRACEGTDLLKTEESKLAGNNAEITKTHNILSSVDKEVIFAKKMEIFWSDKSLIEREFYGYEYSPKNGGRPSNWNDLFQLLENGMSLQCRHLELYNNPECRVYNRYRNVLPYAENRVKLSGWRNDYINASYVSMKGVKRCYIVTQAPLHDTIVHFWEMVWEQKTTGIVMLCQCEENGREKSAAYWPRQVHSCLITGAFMVECTGITESGSYTVTSLEIQNLETQKTHKLQHFQYRAWPDYGVPKDETDFIKFLSAVRDSGILGSSTCPAVVHCSAGIGRSGVFVLLDLALCIVESQRTLKDLDLQDILFNIRAKRWGLVHTPEQLRFAHLAVLAAGHTLLGLEFSVDELKKEVKGEMNAARPVTHYEPIRVVYIDPDIERPQKPMHFPAMTPLPPATTPKSLTASLPSLFSDTDSVFTLSDNQECVPPPPSSLTYTKNTTTNTMAKSTSAWSITSVDSLDVFNRIQTL